MFFTSDLLVSRPVTDLVVLSVVGALCNILYAREKGVKIVSTDLVRLFTFTFFDKFKDMNSSDSVNLSRYT